MAARFPAGEEVFRDYSLTGRFFLYCQIALVVVFRKKCTFCEPLKFRRFENLNCPGWFFEYAAEFAFKGGRITGQQTAVRREFDRLTVGKYLENPELLLRCGVPQANRAVQSAGKKLKLVVIPRYFSPQRSTVPS